MTMFRSGALALLLCTAAAVPAEAAVTYSLTGSVVLDPTIAAIPQSFTFSVDAPLTATQEIPVSAFSACSPGNVGTIVFQCAGAAFLLAGDVANGASPFFSTLVFGGDLPETPDVIDLLTFYQFDPAVFTVNGTATTVGTSPQQGTLTVSGIPVQPPAVPEAATWMLMVAGFGAVGGAMRARNTRVVVRYS